MSSANFDKYLTNKNAIRARKWPWLIMVAWAYLDKWSYLL